MISELCGLIRNKFLSKTFARENSKSSLYKFKIIAHDEQNLLYFKNVTENCFQVSIQEKQNSIESPQESGSSLDHQDSSDMSVSIDTVRSNPNLQVNGTTPNKLELMEQKALTNDFGKIEITTKPIITGAILKEDVAQEDTFQVRITNIRFNNLKDNLKNKKIKKI